MSWLRRFANAFRRPRLDDDIDEELRSHVDMRAVDLERAGLSRDAAAREARQLLGNPASLRDRTRDADVLVQLETAVQDVRFAVRLLLRAPLFTIAAVLTLALGISVNTATFGVLYGVLIHPLPYADADRLYMLFQAVPRTGERTRFAPLAYIDLRERTRAFRVAGVVGTGFTLTGGGDPELVVGQLVAGDFFGILGREAALGRTLTPADMEAPENQLMVLSHRLWHRRFGGDPAIVGRTITANGRPFTIVGVMPADFAFRGERYQLWTPFPFRGANPDNLPITRTSRYMQVLAKLEPGVTTAAAAEDLKGAAETLARDYPDGYTNTRFEMSSLMDETVGNARPALRLVFAAVMLVLLIACGNVTNLLLARFTGRASEVLVRSALGATRLRLIRQFVVETLVLYAAGTAVGLLLASWLLNLLRTMATASIPRAEDIGLLAPVLFFACAVSLATALLFGIAPAWHATRATGSASLGTRAVTSGRSHQRFRSTIVVAQVAIALCLLSGASLIARSLLNLERVDKGFDPAGRLTFSVVMPAARFREPASMHAFYRRLLEILGMHPTFRRVGVTTHLPLSGQDLENGFAIDGYVPPSPELQPVAALRGISHAYLASMGIPLRMGRDFTLADNERAAPVAIVNEAFVRRYFAARNPLDGRISVGDAQGPWRTVVGVVADVRHRGLATEPRPEVLLPYVQLDDGFLTAWARGLSIVVHSEADAAVAAGAIRQQMRDIDPNIPIIELQPMDARVARSVAEPRLRTFVLAVFALIAVALAAVGIFGVLSYIVSERTREIGIRMALGALPRSIFRDVLGQGVRLVLVGTLLGFAGGVVLSRWISGLLFGVTPGDPVTLGAAAGTLAAVALIAAFVPARRATRVNPVLALRS
jgi:putative ABC transport system permease protein